MWPCAAARPLLPHVGSPSGGVAAAGVCDRVAAVWGPVPLRRATAAGAGAARSSWSCAGAGAAAGAAVLVARRRGVHRRQRASALAAGAAVEAAPAAADVDARLKDGKVSAAQLGKKVRRPPTYKTETPNPGDLCRIHYIARLEDGTLFDSSRARGEPFDFILGTGQVIDGWEALIETMAVGERSVLTVPYEYGYGEEGVPPIVPPRTNLTFDVELIDIGRPKKPGEDEEFEEAEAATAAAKATAEAGEAAEDEAFWNKDPDREWGSGAGYTWEATGSGAEICVSVPMGLDTEVKDIKVDVKTNRAYCSIKGKVLFDGDIFAGVDTGDTHWDLERQGSRIKLLIYFVKLDKNLRWKNFLKNEVDEPVKMEGAVKVDVDVVKASSSKGSKGSGGIVDADVA